MYVAQTYLFDGLTLRVGRNKIILQKIYLLMAVGIFYAEFLYFSQPSKGGKQKYILSYTHAVEILA